MNFWTSFCFKLVNMFLILLQAIIKRDSNMPRFALPFGAITAEVRRKSISDKIWINIGENIAKT